MNAVTIEKLKINSDEKLKENTKRALVQIMEQEFNSQRTIYNAESEVTRENILEQYKVGIGFAKLKKDYDTKVILKERAEKKVDEFDEKCCKEMEMLEEKQKENRKNIELEVELADKEIEKSFDKIKHKGLTAEGDRYNSYIDPRNVNLKKAVRKVDELFAAVEDMSPGRIRNKVIARMWLADTHGEACVILQQVLGNGIIPTMTKNLLENK